MESFVSCLWAGQHIFICMRLACKEILCVYFWLMCGYALVYCVRVYLRYICEDSHTLVHVFVADFSGRLCLLVCVVTMQDVRRLMFVIVCIFMTNLQGCANMLRCVC